MSKESLPPSASTCALSVASPISWWRGESLTLTVLLSLVTVHAALYTLNYTLCSLYYPNNPHKVPPPLATLNALTPKNLDFWCFLAEPLFHSTIHTMHFIPWTLSYALYTFHSTLFSLYLAHAAICSLAWLPSLHLWSKTSVLAKGSMKKLTFPKLPKTSLIGISALCINANISNGL